MACPSTLTWVRRLSAELVESAYSARGELAWPAHEAVRAIRQLAANECVVCGVEVWIPTTPGPTIPAPFFYGWDAGAPRAGEAYRDFAARANAGADHYISTFQWDPRDDAHAHTEPYFNITVDDGNAAD